MTGAKSLIVIVARSPPLGSMARPHESSWLHSPLRSARLTACTKHVTCQQFALPRSHAALPPQPDFTCIARTSRHAAPGDCCCRPAPAFLLALVHPEPAKHRCVVSDRPRDHAWRHWRHWTYDYRHGQPWSTAHLRIDSLRSPQSACSVPLLPPTVTVYCWAARPFGSLQAPSPPGPLSGLANHSASSSSCYPGASIQPERGREGERERPGPSTTNGFIALSIVSCSRPAISRGACGCGHPTDALESACAPVHHPQGRSRHPFHHLCPALQLPRPAAAEIVVLFWSPLQQFPP